MLNRREAMRAFGAAAVVAAWQRSEAGWANVVSPRTGVGLVMYCCLLRREQLRKMDPGANLFEPARLLEHARALGAGGVQVRLGILDRDAVRSVRRAAESAGLYLEGIASVPKQKKDVERFDAEMKSAAAVGARAVRTTIIPGRRYEYFDSLEMFRKFEAMGRKSLELATPVAEKYRLPLAVENHKDQRNNERVALLEHISSSCVGACVDTGNSISLLEDPVETVKAFAPWAHSVHLKDQAVRPYENGFLLGDVPLGQGCLDLKKMVRILRDEKPDIRFSLELITRDPLKVPVLTEKYWATFPAVRGRDLARTLRRVRDGATSRLQYISRLPKDQQLAREDANLRASLDYARNQLGL